MSQYSPKRRLTKPILRSGGVALRRPRLALGGFDLAVLGRRGRHQVLQQVGGHVGHLVHRAVEGLGVGLRRLGGAAYLAHVLQRCGADLLVVGGGLEVVERSDVSAHEDSVSPSLTSIRCTSRSGLTLPAPGATWASAGSRPPSRSSSTATTSRCPGAASSSIHRRPASARATTPSTSPTSTARVARRRWRCTSG